MNAFYHTPRSAALNQRQNGFSLIVSLLMLVVIIILGIGATNIALNEERSARNGRDRQIAFQAAEAALIDAEHDLLGPSTGIACGGPSGTQYWGRSAATCFDGTSASVAGFASGCSAPPNEGLCDLTSANNPIWESIDFNDSSANAKTVVYGKYSGNSYPTGGNSQPAKAPRYIIELVPQNNVIGDSLGETNGTKKEQKWMYRVTAIGFGPNENAQVVLQSIVNTKTD